MQADQDRGAQFEAEMTGMRAALRVNLDGRRSRRRRRAGRTLLAGRDLRLEKMRSQYLAGSNCQTFVSGLAVRVESDPSQQLKMLRAVTDPHVDSTGCD